MVSGQDPAIADYLRSELLSSLGDEDQTFLTRSSILEVVEPAVAEAVTGMQRGCGAPALAGPRQLSRRSARGRSRRPTGSTRSCPSTSGPSSIAGSRGRPRAPSPRRRLVRGCRPDRARDRACTGRRRRGDRGAPRPGHHPADALRGAHGPARSLDPGLRRAAPSSGSAPGRRRRLGERPHREGGGRGATGHCRRTFDVRREPGDGSASFESARANLRAVMARRGRTTCSRRPAGGAAEPMTSPWRPWRSTAWRRAHPARRVRQADAVLAAAVDDAAAAGHVPVLRARAALVHRDGAGDWRHRRATRTREPRRLRRDARCATSLPPSTSTPCCPRGDPSWRHRPRPRRPPVLRPARPPTGLVRAPVVSRSRPSSSSRGPISRSPTRRAPGCGRRGGGGGTPPARPRPAERTASSSCTPSATPQRSSPDRRRSLPAELRVLPLLSTHLTFRRSRTACSTPAALSALRTRCPSTESST